MQKWFILISITILTLACQRKSIAISNATGDENNKRTSHNSLSQAVSPGESIYINRCGRCHSLKNTGKYTVEEWNYILPLMTRKARLTDTEISHVTAYVLDNAKK